MSKPKSAAGLIPHAFHGIQTTTAHSQQEWQLQSLQLISLRRFDQPRDYVLDHLPRMDFLNGDEVQTRELSVFENDGLAQLNLGEDVVYRAGEDSIEMLGSIRSQQKCLECHSAQRGQLLGAFTNRFSPLFADQ